MDDYAENCFDYNIYSNAMYNNHALERKRTENKVISGANVTYQHCEYLLKPNINYKQPNEC